MLMSCRNIDMHTHTYIHNYFKLHIIIMGTGKVEFLTDDIAGFFTWVYFPKFILGAFWYAQ